MDIKHISTVLSNPTLVNEPMRSHTTFGIGGDASCYVHPKNRAELSELLLYCHKSHIPIFFAGSGSNLLVSDTGFDGVIISIRKTFKSLNIKSDGTIIVEAGAMLGNMVKNATKAGISGLESLIGVPGTVGGALIMNAGAFGGEISNYFQSATVVTMTGKTKKYTADQISFSYRSSTFPKDEILIEATFKCEFGQADKIDADKQAASKLRKENQPLKFRSAGSIFKNPDLKLAAGYLIDKAGLKGSQSGAAEISTKHANFIVNLGNAKAEDVIKLIRLAQKEVAKQFDIKLELEVKLLGFPNELVKELYHA